RQAGARVVGVAVLLREALGLPVESETVAERDDAPRARLTRELELARRVPCERLEARLSERALQQLVVIARERPAPRVARVEEHDRARFPAVVERVLEQRRVPHRRERRDERRVDDGYAERLRRERGVDVAAERRVAEQQHGAFGERGELRALVLDEDLLV